LAEITIGKRQMRGVSAYGLLKGVLPDYSMTKGGIHAFTRSLATQRVPRGIRVNAVAPGPVWTSTNLLTSKRRLR
jgi:NAD(P)-dependent dehydrogenase (short-subunit alcohol dehydrogenase family)